MALDLLLYPILSVVRSNFSNKLEGNVALARMTPMVAHCILVVKAYMSHVLLLWQKVLLGHVHFKEHICHRNVLSLLGSSERLAVSNRLAAYSTAFPLRHAGIHGSNSCRLVEWEIWRCVIDGSSCSRN